MLKVKSLETLNQICLLQKQIEVENSGQSISAVADKLLDYGLNLGKGAKTSMWAALWKDCIKYAFNMTGNGIVTIHTSELFQFHL